MSAKYTLEILPSSKTVENFYLQRVNYSDDAGIDLFVPEDVTIAPNQVTKVDLNIKCRMVDETGQTVGYYMYPRSSIANTPFMLANSVGIIDKSYRGAIKAAIRSFSDAPEEIKQGIRLVQITAPDLSALNLKIVETLDTTERGENGFGSTS